MTNDVINVVQVKTISLHPHEKHAYFHTHYSQLTEFESIKRDVEMHGIKIPLLVQSGTNVIVDGHMRHGISLDLRLETVPVIYEDMTEEEALFGLVYENRKRQQGERNPIKLARQVSVLKKELGLRNGEHHKNGEKKSMDEIARELGFKPRQLYNYLRLMHLTKEFQALVSAKTIGIRSAVEIARKSFDDQKALYQIAIRSGAPKNALSHEVVREWLSIFEEEQAKSFSDERYTMDVGLLNQVDRALSEIDGQYDTNELPGVDQYQRQAIIALAETLSQDAGAKFQQVVVRNKIEKQIRTLKRVEQRLMGLMLPDSGLEIDMLDDIDDLLVRCKQKLDEVRLILDVGNNE